MMHFVESHPDSFAPFLREMGNEYERHEIFFFFFLPAIVCLM